MTIEDELVEKEGRRWRWRRMMERRMEV